LIGNKDFITHGLWLQFIQSDKLAVHPGELITRFLQRRGYGPGNGSS